MEHNTKELFKIGKSARELRCKNCNKLLGKGTAQDLGIKCPGVAVLTM